MWMCCLQLGKNNLAQRFTLGMFCCELIVQSQSFVSDSGQIRSTENQYGRCKDFWIFIHISVRQ